MQRAYADQARSYDRSTRAYQSFRREIVEALSLQPGEVVVDVGCGTGLCLPMLVEKVGPRGAVIGVDSAPEMIAQARERVSAEGWTNVTLVESSVETVRLPVVPDAALFCAVHDVMRSPVALRNILGQLRPGAWVAAGGGKWAPPWMVAVNLQVMSLHRPYIGNFEGFERPWSHLEQLARDVDVDELAFGAGYLATGRVPWADGGEGY